MARRKPPTVAEAIIAPTPERWARGDVDKPGQAIADEEGRPASPFRAITTLVAMERKGTIKGRMRQAGEQFHGDFVVAGLEQLRAADMGRISGGSGGLRLVTRQIDARQRVWEAIVALGGIASPAGCCVWHVLGHAATIKEWALREGWGGRPIDQKIASGILVSALGVLVVHYGLEPNVHSK